MPMQPVEGWASACVPPRSDWRCEFSHCGKITEHAMLDARTIRRAMRWRLTLAPLSS